MKPNLLVFLGMACAVGCGAAGPENPLPEPSPGATARRQFQESFRRLPLQFEPSQGPADAPVRFLARGLGYQLFLASSETVLVLRDAAVLRQHFAGANPEPRMSGEAELPGRVNYLHGRDPARWRTGIPIFQKVRVEAVYPGIDVVYYGNQRQLEYDLVVGPGADPNLIRIGIAGTDGLELSPAGDLVLRTAGGDLVQRAPIAYQELDGRRRMVPVRYALDCEAPARVRFELGLYDPAQRVIIDPVLNYSTCLGGSDEDTAFGLAVDANGNAYVAGSTKSIDFPTVLFPWYQASLQPFPQGYLDAFVSKFNAAGTALLYTTYLGGEYDDEAHAIAIGPNNNAYLTGFTMSSNFPVTATAYRTNLHGCSDVFVVRLSTDGRSLVFGSYLGGDAQDPLLCLRCFIFCGGWDWGGLFGSVPTLDLSWHLFGEDVGNAIAVDPDGNAFVTGFTWADDFPATFNRFNPNLNAYQRFRSGGMDAFVTKFSADGTRLVYSTYLGGDADDIGNGIAIDAAGNAYVVGSTASTNFPATANVLQRELRGPSDAFVAKLNATGHALYYSTYLGGSGAGVCDTLAGGIGGQEQGNAIAIDTGGHAYVTGTTLSSDFPTTMGSLQPVYGGGIQVSNSMQGYFFGTTVIALPSDAFIAELNPNASDLVYSTYLGGTGNDYGIHLALDAAGNAYVAGTTGSTNFPVVHASQPALGGGGDAFIVKVNTNGSALAFSSYLGGASNDIAYAVALDNNYNVYLAGATFGNFPTTPGAYRASPVGGTNDAFVVKFADIPNDYFLGRILLAGFSNSIAGANNTFTSKEPGEPNAGGNIGGQSLWWSWTAPSTAPVTINTIGSSFDTLLGIYTGNNVSNLVAVASNDDISSTNRASGVMFMGVQGTVYQIQVDGYNGASGNIVLNIIQEYPLPVLLGIDPAGAIATGPNFTLGVHGSNFVRDSVVVWNGSSRSTVFLSSTQLTAAISQADISSAGSVEVRVYTPYPGGGYSGPLTFTIAPPNPVPALVSLNPSWATAGGTTFALTVNGTNFLPGSIGRWNGGDRATIYFSPKQLVLAITDADVAAPGTATVTVANSAPGGGISGGKAFTIYGLGGAQLKLAAVAATNGTFQYQVLGPVGSDVVIQDSTNLFDWTPVATNTLTDPAISVTDTNADGTNRFYRGLLTP